MLQHEIHRYLYNFFTANHCEIIQQTPHLLDVQLTIEMDKLLMNRPFYWHYVEKTGGVPTPMRMNFITNQNAVPEDTKGEVIHYGSPRLHQIFGISKELGSYIRLYEQAKVNQQTSLHPWLAINAKVSYQCDRKKDVLYSIGLHLLTGTMVNHFHEFLQNLVLTPKIPDFCFTISPIIRPQSGLVRIEQAITSLIEQEEHTWAEEARQRWNYDLQLLNQFYEDEEHPPESYAIEKQALQDQYEPKIIIQPINAGIFYLHTNPLAEEKHENGA